VFSNAQQSIPLVFREIIKNDNRRAEIKANAVVPSSDLAEYRALRADRHNLRQGAMKMLQRLNDPSAPKVR
jgi:hypothetical protein